MFLEIHEVQRQKHIVYLLAHVCCPLKEMSVSFQQQDACDAEIHETLKSAVAVINLKFLFA